MSEPNTKQANNNAVFWGVILGLVILGFIVLISAYVVKGNNQSTNNTIISDPSPAPPPSDKDENGCYTPSTVRKHYGETDCVVFTVAYTYETSAGTKFIDEKVDYKNGFAVYIPRDSNFSTVELSQFEGKKIKATGLISEYNGSPQIEATEYSQVTIFR